jgi:hypothetical protein
MIKAEELKIGNYFQWSEFASMGIGECICDKENIFEYLELKESIPLTEEWLVKLGGKKHVQYGAEWSIGSSNKQSICIEFDNDGCYFTAGEGMYLSTNIKYVHQLQNLYFALTGEELIIKQD